jgi:hypothetical protein
VGKLQYSLPPILRPASLKHIAGSFLPYYIGDFSEKFQFHACQTRGDPFFCSPEIRRIRQVDFELVFKWRKTESKGKKSFPKEQGL